MQPDSDRNTERLSVVSDLVLRDLAHDLRNALAPMQSAIEVMKLDATMSVQSAAMRSVLERQFKNLLATVNEFAERVTPAQTERPSVTQSPPEQTESVVELQRLEILVVDDMRAATHTLKTQLELLGQHVRTASSGLDALIAVRERIPQIVFSDVGMQAMDGYELAKQIRSLPQGTSMRLVAVTGHGTSEDKRRAVEAGFDEHIIKPITHAALVSVLKNYTKRLN